MCIRRARCCPKSEFNEYSRKLVSKSCSEITHFTVCTTGDWRMVATAGAGRDAAVSWCRDWRLVGIWGSCSGWQLQGWAVLFSVCMSHQSLLLITRELCHISVIYFGDSKWFKAVIFNCAVSKMPCLDHYAVLELRYLRSAHCGTSLAFSNWGRPSPVRGFCFTLVMSPIEHFNPALLYCDQSMNWYHWLGFPNQYKKVTSCEHLYI